MVKHCNVRVFGRVHNVGFRWSAVERAQRTGLRGFIRNDADSVYLEVEGDEAAVQTFLAWCRKGPALARVERAEVTEGAPCGFDSFSTC